MGAGKDLPGDFLSAQRFQKAPLQPGQLFQKTRGTYFASSFLAFNVPSLLSGYHKEVFRFASSLFFQEKRRHVERLNECGKDRGVDDHLLPGCLDHLPLKCSSEWSKEEQVNEQNAIASENHSEGGEDPNTLAGKGGLEQK